MTRWLARILSWAASPVWLPSSRLRDAPPYDWGPALCFAEGRNASGAHVCASGSARAIAGGQQAQRQGARAADPWDSGVAFGGKIRPLLRMGGGSIPAQRACHKHPPPIASAQDEALPILQRAAARATPGSGHGMAALLLLLRTQTAAAVARCSGSDPCSRAGPSSPAACLTATAHLPELRGLRPSSRLHAYGKPDGAMQSTGGPKSMRRCKNRFCNLLHE